MPRMYKDILMDYRRMEEVSSFPRRSYCLSETTVQMILALSESFYWHTRWQMPPEESPHDWTASEVAQIKTWASRLERELSTICGDCDGCPPNDIDCIDYPPSTARLDYEPANPFTEAGTIPPGYIGEPFTVVKETDVGLILLGFQVGDVMTDLTRYPGGATAPEIIEYGLPRFILSYTAPAEIEFHFVQFPGGGRAVIRRDFDINPLNWTIVELNKDLINLPPETVTEIVIEFNDESTGEHTYEVSFVPNVDEEIPFIFFGGGLRKITICGEDASEECPEVMPYEIRQDEGTPCIIEASTDGGETWTAVVNLDNCPPAFQIRQDTEQPCNLDFSPNRGEAWFTFANLQLCPPKQRWRGGILEWFDGDDWIPFDNIDPVYTDPPPPRPRPEEEPNDPRCSSAASAAYAYLELANRLHGILSNPFNLAPIPIGVAAEFAGVASDVLNFFHSSDAFTNIGANIAFQANTTAYLVSLFVEAVSNTVTPDSQFLTNLGLTDSDTRDRLKCALYCITGEAGTIPPDQVADALDNAIAENGLASGWTAFVNLFGAGGVNAASSVGAFSVPASDCDCPDCPTAWCKEWDFTVTDGSAEGWAAFGIYGHWTSGVGWQETTNEGLIITNSFADTTITYVEWDCVSGNGSSPEGCGTLLRDNGSNVVVETDPLNTPPAGWEGNVVADQILLNPFAGFASTHTISRCLVRGTGTSPFGGNNC